MDPTADDEPTSTGDDPEEDVTDTESAEEELTDADLDGIVGAGGRVKDLPGVGEPYIVVEVDPD